MDRFSGGVAVLAGLVVIAGSFGSTVFYFLEHSVRARNERFQAWQIVSSMEGKGGEGGRRDALRGLKEQGVSLAGVVLDNAVIEDLDLSTAQLARASFKDAFLPRLDLRAAQMELAELSDAKLAGANLTATELAKARMVKTLLVDSALDNAEFIKVEAPGAAFNRATFRGARIANSDLTKATLRSSVLSGAKLVASVFDDTDLLSSDLNTSFWWEVRALNLACNRCTGDNVNVSYSTFDGGSFERARLLAMTVVGSSFRGVSFRSADLSGTTFRGTDLTEANFSGATMTDVVFINCILDRVVWDRVKDSDTIQIMP